MIEKLEDDLIGFLPGFVSLVGDDREVVAAKADNQVAREAVIQLPSAAGEALYYLFYSFVIHASSSSFPVSQSSKQELEVFALSCLLCA